MSRRSITVSLAFSLLFPLPSVGQGRPPQKPQGRVIRSGPAFLQSLKTFDDSNSGTRAVLSNGLTVIVQEAHTNPVVSITICFKAGFGINPDNPASADVTAELYFSGAKTRAGSVLAREIRVIGAASQSSVEYDYTLHDIVTPSAQWKKALEFQADAYFNPAYDDDEVRSAIQRIRLRWQARERDQEERAMYDGIGLVYGNSGPGLIPRERLQSLERVDLAQILSFRSTACIPGRTILVIAGDVNSTEVLSEAVRLYSGAKALRPKPVAPTSSSSGAPFRYLRQQAAGSYSHIVLGYATPGSPAELAPALEVLSCMLGEGEGSILGRRLVAQKGVALKGSARWISGLGWGALILRMETESSSVDRAEIALLAELELLKGEEQDQEYVDRAVAQLERLHWTRVQTPSGRAQTLARFEMEGDWKKMLRYSAAIRKVTTADVRRAAQQYLKLERCALLEYMPAAAEARNLTSETALQTLQSLLKPAADQEAAERERETILPVRFPPAAEAFKANEIRHGYRLASVWKGPEIVVREDHSVPLVRMGLFYPGGVLAETKKNSGITALMLHAMLQGSKSWDDVQLYRQLDLLGAQIQPVLTHDHFGFEVEVLSKNAEACLEVLAEVIKVPLFDPEHLPRVKKRLQAARDAQELDPEILARGLARSALFRESPYSLSPLGEKSVQEELQSEDLKAWHTKYVARVLPTVVLLGDTLGTSLAGFFVRNFSGSRYEPAKLGDAFAKGTASQIQLEGRSPDGLSHLLIALQAPPEGDEDLPLAKVAAEYLGNPSGALYESVVHSGKIARQMAIQYAPQARGGILWIYLSDVTGAPAEVIAALEKAAEKMRSAPMLYRDYRSAVQAATRASQLDLEKRSAQIAGLIGSFFVGKGIQGFEEIAARVQEVQQEELNDAVDRILRFDKAIVVWLKAGS